MNSVNLIGRMVKDAELRTTQSGKSVTVFTVAVNSDYKNADGNYDAYFIDCVAWDKRAELICSHFPKGSQIGITGRLTTRTYTDKDEKVRKVTEVIVDGITFVGSKIEKPASEQPNPFNNDGFMPMPDTDNILPF